jgi:hypothetical protein
MWAPPATICERWLRFAPVATVISTINHSEIGVISSPQLSDFVAGGLTL